MISAVYIASALDYISKLVKPLEVNLYPEMSYSPELAWETDKVFHKTMALNTIGPDLDNKFNSWQDDWTFLQWTKAGVQRPDSVSEIRPFQVRYDSAEAENKFRIRHGVLAQIPITLKFTTNNPMFAEALEAWAFLDMTLLIGQKLIVSCTLDDLLEPFDIETSISGMELSEMQRIEHSGEDYLYTVGLQLKMIAPIFSINSSLYPQLKKICVRLWTRDFLGFTPDDPVRVWTIEK